jgi:hypothetical protein
LVPSADEAMDVQFRLDSWAVQETPESDDVYMRPPKSAATSLIPSADEAMENQVPLDPWAVQLVPESADV